MRTQIFGDYRRNRFNEVPKVLNTVGAQVVRGVATYALATYGSKSAFRIILKICVDLRPKKFIKFEVPALDGRP
jgi:hypothetical protein